MKALLAVLLVALFSGCTASVPRKPPAPTFQPVWFSRNSPEQEKGYTLNGVPVGGSWTELQERLDKVYEVEKVDWRYQVSDPKSQAAVTITVDDSGKVVTVWSNSGGSLEKDGRPLLRTQESEDVALRALALPAGAKMPWLIHEGPMTVLVDGGPAVYSISLWDEAFRQSTLTEQKP